MRTKDYGYSPPWTKTEMAILRAVVEGGRDRRDYDRAAEMLPGRSAHACEVKAARMGVARMDRLDAGWWTAREVERLKALWGEVPVTEIAREVGRSVAGVYGKARALGLHGVEMRRALDEHARSREQLPACELPRPTACELVAMGEARTKRFREKEGR